MSRAVCCHPELPRKGCSRFLEQSFASFCCWADIGCSGSLCPWSHNLQQLELHSQTPPGAPVPSDPGRMGLAGSPLFPECWQGLRSSRRGQDGCRAAPDLLEHKHLWCFISAFHRKSILEGAEKCFVQLKIPKRTRAGRM